MPFTSEQLLQILSFLFVTVFPAVITLFTLWLDRRIKNAQAKKIEKEASKIDDEASEVQANSAQILSQTAAQITKVQQNVYGQQIRQIKIDMANDRRRHEREINELTRKMNEIQRVDRELKVQNAFLRRIIRKWKVGIQKLLLQLQKAEIIPVWVPTDDVSDIT